MKKFLGKFSLIFAGLLLFAGSASAINLPSGEIGCDNSGGTHCYMIYLPPGGSTYKKYIGSPSVRTYYNPLTATSLDPQPAFNEANFTGIDLSSYPTYNWNLGLPSGVIVGDKSNGKLYIMEPIAADGDPGSGVGNFSYSNAFPLYVPALNTATLANLVTPSRITWLPSVANVLGDTTDGNSLPAGTIVKQAGTNDFYRLMGFVATDGRKNASKQYIPTSELLSLWLMKNHFYVTADVSGYSSSGSVGMPPSLLVRTASNPTVYFTDDNGHKQQIRSAADFSSLGFSTQGVRYVQQSTLDSTPSQVWTP
jgi:hypothetical protein